MSKVIYLKVHTGFAGAAHEEEIPYTGQSESELERLAIDFYDEVVSNYIEYEYTIEDDGDDD